MYLYNGYPLPGVSSDFFSIVLTGYLRPMITGNYSFTCFAQDSNDACVLYLNGSQVTSTTQLYYLTSNTNYRVRIELREYNGWANFALSWTLPNTSTLIIIPTDNFMLDGMPTTDVVPGVVH